MQLGQTKASYRSAWPSAQFMSWYHATRIFNFIDFGDSSVRGRRAKTRRGGQLESSGTEGNSIDGVDVAVGEGEGQ